MPTFQTIDKTPESIYNIERVLGVTDTEFFNYKLNSSFIELKEFSQINSLEYNGDSVSYNGEDIYYKNTWVVEKYVDGKFGYALFLDNDNYAVISGLKLYENYTLMFWVKFDDNSGEVPIIAVEKSNQDAVDLTYQGEAVEYNSEAVTYSAILAFYAGFDFATNELVLIDKNETEVRLQITNIDPASFNHFIFKYDNKSLSVYVNGKPYHIDNFEFEATAKVFVSSLRDESVNVKMTIDQIRYSPIALPNIHLKWLYNEVREYIKSNKYIPYFAEEYFAKKITGEVTENFDVIYGRFSYISRGSLANNEILADGRPYSFETKSVSLHVKFFDISSYRTKIGFICPPELDGFKMNHLSLVNKETDYEVVYAEITFDTDYTLKQGHTYEIEVGLNFGNHSITRPYNMYWVEEREFGPNILYVGLTDIPENDVTYTITKKQSTHEFLRDKRLILSNDKQQNKILLVRYGTLCEGNPPDAYSFTDCYDVDNFKSKSFVTTINHSSVGDHYGDLYICKFKPEYSGEWKFKLEGDDAHQLEIDGEIVCSAQNTDTVLGSIQLTKGVTYTLIVRHFEGTGGDSVKLYFWPPNKYKYYEFNTDNLLNEAEVWSYDISPSFITKRQLSSTGEVAFYGTENYSVDYLNSTSVNLSVPYDVSQTVSIKEGTITFMRYRTNSYGGSHDDMLNRYYPNDIYFSGTTDKINMGNYGDNYGMVVSFMFTPNSTGDWSFAIDSDDAGEIEVNGTVIASWYGVHGTCNCQDHNGTITFEQGKTYTVIARQQEGGGGDWLRVWVKAPNENDWSVLDVAYMRQFGYIRAYGANDNNKDLFKSTFILNGIPNIEKHKCLVYSIKESGDFTFDSTTEFDILKIQG